MLCCVRPGISSERKISVSRYLKESFRHSIAASICTSATSERSLGRGPTAARESKRFVRSGISIRLYEFVRKDISLVSRGHCIDGGLGRFPELDDSGTDRQPLAEFRTKPDECLCSHRRSTAFHCGRRGSKRIPGSHPIDGPGQRGRHS